MYRRGRGAARPAPPGWLIEVPHLNMDTVWTNWRTTSPCSSLRPPPPTRGVDRPLAAGFARDCLGPPGPENCVCVCPPAPGGPPRGWGCGSKRGCLSKGGCGGGAPKLRGARACMCMFPSGGGGEGVHVAPRVSFSFFLDFLFCFFVFGLVFFGSGLLAKPGLTSAEEFTVLSDHSLLFPATPLPILLIYACLLPDLRIPPSKSCLINTLSELQVCKSWFGSWGHAKPTQS